MSQSVAQLLATSERLLKRKKSTAKKKAAKTAKKKARKKAARKGPSAAAVRAHEMERLALQVALFGRPVKKKTAKKKTAKKKTAKKPSKAVKPNSRGTKAEREAWARKMKRARAKAGN